MNRQPWHFIVVQNRDSLRQLGALAKTGPYIAQAALAIVVVIQRTPFSVSDGSRAIQSMMLTAWSEGVGSNWVGFMGMAEVKPLLGVADDLDVLAIIPFGVSGSARRQRTEKSQATLRGGPSRALRTAVSMTRLPGELQNLCSNLTRFLFHLGDRHDQTISCGYYGNRVHLRRAKLVIRLPMTISIRAIRSG